MTLVSIAASVRIVASRSGTEKPSCSITLPSLPPVEVAPRNISRTAPYMMRFGASVMRRPPGMFFSHHWLASAAGSFTWMWSNGSIVVCARAEVAAPINAAARQRAVRSVRIGDMISRRRPAAGHFEPVQFLFDLMERVVADLVVGTHGEHRLTRRLEGATVEVVVR